MLNSENGPRLRSLRDSLGISGAKFAKALGISPAHLSQIENGKGNASGRVLSAVVSEFGVNEDWLQTGEGEMFSDLSILATHHPDPWVQGFLKQLVDFWHSGDYVAIFMIDEGFELVFDDRWTTWVAARRPVPSAAELQYITQLNDIHKAADDERLVEVAPRTATLLTRQISLLAYSKVTDYCDFLKEWWDKASEDEHAWARVELKRRLPMLF